MSKFREYARKVNTIARAAMEGYTEAAEKAQKADERYNATIARYRGNSGPEAQAAIARARADMLEAQQAKKQAQAFMQKEIDSVAAVGRELKAAVSAAFTADGSQVDMATLELLKSGILKSDEYVSLYNAAANSGNHTMMRLIGKYAGDVAQDAPTKEKETQLRQLESMSRAAMGGQYLEAFNMLQDTYARTANNPSMIKSWDMLTAETIENF